MTYKEYCNQPPLQKCSSFSVILKKEDCFHIYDVKNGRIVDIKFNEKHYTYFIPKESKDGSMYTMDEDGNKKRASVFRLEE